jgi:hypothetical protein
MSTKVQNFLIVALLVGVGYLGYKEFKRETDLGVDLPIKPNVTATRNITVDSVSVTDSKGNVVLTFIGEPTPYVEIKSKGRTKRLDLAKLADKADMFMENP